MNKKEYLGDGVYAEFDGCGVWLTANAPTTDEIYLEPEVIMALMGYFEKMMYGQGGEDNE